LLAVSITIAAGGFLLWCSVTLLPAGKAEFILFVLVASAVRTFVDYTVLIRFIMVGT
jgi:hypothetical protein